MTLRKDPATDKRVCEDMAFIADTFKAPRVWTLFMHRNGARVFENDNGLLSLVRKFRHTDYRPGSEPLSFFETIAVWLDEAVWDDCFDQLILTGPCSIMERITPTLSLSVQGRTTRIMNWPVKRA